MEKAIQVDRKTGHISINFGEIVYGDNTNSAARMLTCNSRGSECAGNGYLNQVSVDGQVGEFVCIWLAKYGMEHSANCDQFLA